MGCLGSKAIVLTCFGDSPETACKNLENYVIEYYQSLKVNQSVIITIAGDTIKPLIMSPRSSAVNRIAIATINSKNYNIKLTKRKLYQNTEFYQYAASINLSV